MNRRAFARLGTGVAGSLLAGCLTPPSAGTPTLPDGEFSAPAACEPSDGAMASAMYGSTEPAYAAAEPTPLSLSIDPESPTFGETVTVQVENSSERNVSFVSGQPFTLLQRRSGEWREILWTQETAVLQSATEIRPGGSLTIRFEMAREGLSERSFRFCQRVGGGAFAFAFVRSEEPLPTVPFRLR